MRKLFLSAAALFIITVGFAQSKDSSGDGLLKKAGGLLGKVKDKTGGSSLSTDEIISGLKEALVVGTNNSTGKLSAADGFFRDAAVKVLLPPEAVKVEQKLRQLGMGKLVDDAILSINRAAEDASKSAAPIFVDAVKKMTVQDAMGILKGADTAATGYLRSSTSPQLIAAFKPVIESSLQKTGATKYWKDVFDAYNKFTLRPVNPDLSSFVTGKAIDGIFYYVADEEKKIRTNPAARVNDILKKVFGGS
ncbi:DUF4197 domain-containing protein [Flavihumibacter stibioxidans]|uniref:DUF4197 domain-containing protein n=1 Tax=Flavihumibacter stibioxidans TaxID=1834163 RepID=A0ABR7MDG7_9BACT|nr:DUF4197 domain-containing protein [Flavihumibacter stibioxidans]MBC6493069.1 hypothetical protein [Flavihumibacter stibioxidans]